MAKHQPTEDWLRKQNISYTYEPAILLTAIKLDKESRKNIRLGAPLDQDVVLRYMLDYERGDEFPAIALFQNGGRTFDVATGLHRIEAMSNIMPPRTATDAYILDVESPKTRGAVQRTINNFNGFGPGTDERLQHGVWMVGQKWSIKDAASWAGCRVSALGDLVRVGQVKHRMREVGLDPNQMGLSHTVCLKMYQIKNPDVLKAVAKLAYAAHLQLAEHRELVTEVRAATSDKKAMEIIDEWSERLKDRTIGDGVLPPVSPIRKLGIHLKRTHRLFDPAESDRDGVRDLPLAELTGMLTVAREMVRRLTRWVKTLERQRGTMMRIKRRRSA